MLMGKLEQSLDEPLKVRMIQVSFYNKNLFRNAF